MFQQFNLTRHIAALLLLVCFCQPGAESKGESFGELKSRADFLFFHGDMAKAKEIYLDLLEMKPDACDVKLTLLNVLLKLEDTKGAIKILYQLIETKPKDAFLRLILANLLKKEKNLDEAINQLEEAIRFNPKAANLHSALGFSYLDSNKTDQAKAEFEQAKVSPANFQDAQIGLAIIAFKEKNFVEAEAILEQVAQKEKKLSPVVHELRGHLKAAQGKEDEAISHFDKAVEAQSKSATVHSTLGNLHFKNQRFDQAERSFRKSVKLDDKSCDNFYALGVVLNKQGKKEEAASNFRQGAARDKDASRALQMDNLANILMGNGKESFTLQNYPKLDQGSAQSVFGASYDQVFEEMLRSQHK